MPGENPLEAARLVFGELGGEPGMPFLPQLPERGPGADPVGRAAALLVDLPVDLQPSGWRLVDRPGRDLHRARSYLTSDTDALAEAADGYRGPLLTTVTGPWTLAGAIWLQRGERIACDLGAARDLAASLAEGVAEHVRTLQRLVPGAEVIVQFDEPGLPAALEGRLATVSGYGRLRAVEPYVAQEVLTSAVATIRLAGARVSLRCNASRAPMPVLRGAAPDALAVNLGGLTPRAWESVAVAVESGIRLTAGVLDVDETALPSTASVVDEVIAHWERVGLSAQDLLRVDIAPTAGFSGVHLRRIRQLLELAVRAAGALTDVARG